MLATKPDDLRVIPCIYVRELRPDIYQLSFDLYTHVIARVPLPTPNKQIHEQMQKQITVPQFVNLVNAIFKWGFEL